MHDLIVRILHYYEVRKLKMPDVWRALAFAQTELGEVYELLLARDGGWVRNNPDSKTDFDKDALATELGDVIMMLIIAGVAEGVDPISALLRKMKRKLSSIMQEQ